MSDNILFKVALSRELKVIWRVRSRKLFKQNETKHISVFPYIFQLKKKGTAYFFLSLRIKSQSNDPEYHEHDCTFAYIHM